jgi:murein DD-endopeptidase MepM/ murein hydrolase activator NlpD
VGYLGCFPRPFGRLIVKTFCERVVSLAVLGVAAFAAVFALDAAPEHTAEASSDREAPVAEVAVMSVYALGPQLYLSTDVPETDVVDITFPVAGPNTYIDDFDHRRGAGRAHRATDIMADYGQRVHAAVGGEVVWITGLEGPPPGYGYMITIAGDDGRKYHYVHLGRQNGPPDEAYAPGIVDGVRVERGQHIGYVGCSGNASCDAPHLHFEIQDPDVRDEYGSDYVNPYESLRWAELRGDVPRP